MNNRQKKFAEQYAAGLSATAAYLASGYQVKNEAVAASNASELLRNPKIQCYIQELQQQQQHRTGIDADRVLNEYAKIAFSNIFDVIEIGDEGMKLKPPERMPEGASSAIASISSSPGKLTVRFHDKLKALEALATHMGLNSDLNQAKATFKAYGYRIQETDRGYELIDTYAESAEPEAPSPRNLT